MKRDNGDSSGFSLVEVVIAMFILGMIAIAVLPTLWQGIQLSSEQSAVATATRHLNSLIEEARANAACGRTVSRPPAAPASLPANIPAIPNPAAFSPTNSTWNGVSFTDGKGAAYTIVASGAADATGIRAAYACVPNTVAEMELTARDSSGTVVAEVTAKILMGP